MTLSIKRISFYSIIYGFIILFLIGSLFPLFWMLTSSLKPEGQATEFPPRFIPKTFTLENYIRIFTVTLVPRFVVNTFGMGIVSILGVIFLGSLAAYGFSRYEFKAKSILLILMLASIMISGVTIIVPLYIIFLRLRVLNTYFVLFLVYVTQSLPISTWLLRAHINSLPRSLDEAAMIDGYGRIAILLKIILPLSKPGIIAASLFTLVVVWREFILATTFITKSELKTLPVGVYQFFTELGIEWGKLGATVMVATLPIATLFFLLQRHFNPGQISSGLK